MTLDYDSKCNHNARWNKFNNCNPIAFSTLNMKFDMTSNCVGNLRHGVRCN